MDNDTTRDVVRRSLKRVERWVEAHEYKGYEPFDGLSSIWRPLTFKSLLLDRLLMQLIRQSPINLRPIMGVKPLDSTIGRGYMAWGYLTMLRISGDEEYERKARSCLAWLMEHKSPAYDEFCWGKHFDFAGRGGRYPKLEPITVWSSLIGLAFLEAYETLAEPIYLDVAQSLCRWISRLPRSVKDTGVCLSYTGSGDVSSEIHNHNMLAAAVLARTGKHDPRPGHRDLAARIMRYSCSCQRSDGSWYYGETPTFRWIDNFHTGYNLDALKIYIGSTGDETFLDNLRKGFDFYLSHFFEESGRPRYYHNRTYPVDSQCISQSIDTLAHFADTDGPALALALKVARWAIGEMQDRRGFFYFRQYPLIKAKTPMLHWAQATTYRALAHLLERMTGS